MTAEDLLRQLAAAGVSADVVGDDLALDGELPAGLEPLVVVLQAPLVAMLSGRKLFAITSAGRGCRPGGEISPRGLLPADAHLLCVEGAAAWDRVPAHARDEFPDLFEKPTPARRAA